MLYEVPEGEPIKRKQPPPGRLIYENTYPNLHFKSMSDILKVFLKDAQEDASKTGIEAKGPNVACLAVAGVVTENSCRLTNLDWVINGRELRDAFGITHVEVINDFVAQGYGILTLGEHEVDVLQETPAQEGRPWPAWGRAQA